MNPPRDSSFRSAFFVSVDHVSTDGVGDGAPLRNLNASFERSHAAEAESCVQFITSSIVRDSVSCVQLDKDSAKEAFFGWLWI